MRIWIIKMLYCSLSACEKWECHRFLKQPPINDILLDQSERIDRKWLKAATYKATRSNDGEIK